MTRRHRDYDRVVWRIGGWPELRTIVLVAQDAILTLDDWARNIMTRYRCGPSRTFRSERLHDQMTLHDQHQRGVLIARTYR